MVNLPTLYKMGSSGRIQQWSISYDGDSYTIEHGQRFGRLQSTTTDGIEGKNIGRSNETSPEEQAKLEAESLWRKQKDRKGYTQVVPNEVPFRPMLAQKFSEHSKKIKWPCYVSPKLDGLRCLAFYSFNREEVVYMSRQGKFFSTLEHLSPELLEIVKAGHVLDGELYSHAYKSNFQKLLSLIKRDTPNTLTHEVEYHVYDLISDEDYEGRYTTLSSLLKGLNKVKLVESKLVNNEEEVRAEHDKYVADGYEGAMIRNLKGPYEINKRSYNLQKFKQFDDAEFKIVGAEQNVGKQAGQCSLVCETDGGKLFNVKPRGSDAEREWYWEEYLSGNLFGKMLTVRFFGYTNDGIPRFPVGISLRDYE